MSSKHQVCPDGPPIVVIGAGLTGMAVATMLAGRGLPVTVVERNDRAAFGQQGDHPRLRTGASHAGHPHILRAGARDILRRSLPAVLSEAYALGARDTVQVPRALVRQEIAFIGLRRTLLERAFLTCAPRLDTLTLRFGERVLGLTSAGRRVTGVRTATATLPARLVIDASGRLGSVLPGRDTHRPGRIDLRSPLYYTSRPFRLSADGFAAARDGVSDKAASTPPDVAHIGLFFHDRPYASLLVVLSSALQPPDRRAVLAAYAAAMSDPRLRPYLAGAVPLAPIQSMGFLRSTLCPMGTGAPAWPEGVHRIGDALASVEVLTSRGVTLGLLQAEVLAEAISRDPSAHASHREAVLRVYHDWVAPHWADGVIRGRYLRPGQPVPREIAPIVHAARRRHRRECDILQAWVRSGAAAHPGQRELAAVEARANLAKRVQLLQAPPSALADDGTRSDS